MCYRMFTWCDKFEDSPKCPYLDTFPYQIFYLVSKQDVKHCLARNKTVLPLECSKNKAKCLNITTDTEAFQQKGKESWLLQKY